MLKKAIKIFDRELFITVYIPLCNTDDCTGIKISQHMNLIWGNIFQNWLHFINTKVCYHCVKLSVECYWLLRWKNITENISVSLDNEHGSVEQIQVDGNNINIYISDYGDYYYAFWNIDYYYMELTYHGTTTIEEIQKLISLIQ